jgi:hypothetical protein
MKKTPLLPMTIINRFERAITPLEEGEEKTKPTIVNDIRSVC